MDKPFMAIEPAPEHARSVGIVFGVVPRTEPNARFFIEVHYVVVVGVWCFIIPRRPIIESAKRRAPDKP